MAYAQTITPRSSLFASLFSGYSNAKAEFARRRMFGKTTRALNALSDRQLADIGIPREHINRHAYLRIYDQRRHLQ